MDTGKVCFVIGMCSFLTFVQGARSAEQSEPSRVSKPPAQSKRGDEQRSKRAAPEKSQTSLVEKGEIQSTEPLPNETDTLRAFESAGRMEGQNVKLFVSLLIFGTVGVIVIFFIVYALLYEPSEISKPYRPTEVRRGENFVPYQHSRSRGENDQ
jgi:hypothetical protein